jgi:hypothetical protein
MIEVDEIRRGWRAAQVWYCSRYLSPTIERQAQRIDLDSLMVLFHNAEESTLVADIKVIASSGRIMVGIRQ